MRPRRSTTRAVPSRCRERRGAITVMVGLMMVGLMMISAIAIDGSRALAVRNELRTAADAAALAAAVQLGRDAPVSQDSAAMLAADYARRNYSSDGAIDSVTTQFGVWRPDSRTFIAGGGPYDAMQVTVHQRVNFLLGGLLGQADVRMRASAIAWSAAPVNETRCVKPWALPYRLLLNAVDPTSDDDERELTDEDIRRLRELTQEERTFTIRFGDGETDDTTDSDPTDDYYGIDMPATYRAADGSTETPPWEDWGEAYGDNILGCNDAPLARGDSVRAEQGTKRNMTVRAVTGRYGTGRWPGPELDDDDRREYRDWRRRNDALCALFAAGTCYNESGEIGVPVKAVFFSVPRDWEGCGHHCNLPVRMVGSFVLTGMVSSSNPFRHGTMTGYLSLVRDHDGTIGTGSSMLHRPVLVR